MSEKASRTRTFSWDDPRAGLERALAMSGREMLRAMAAGELPKPPIGALMDFKRFEVADNHVAIALDPAEFHYNPVGTAHGGLAATLLDAAMWCAIQAELDKGRFCQTLDIAVNYVRPIAAETGEVVATGRVIHLGSRVATADGRVTDRGGQLYAHSTTTSLIVDVGA
jgi:uncharacterized protein (TIGR00369 family)